ncbi:trans-aconitate methyltransferase [Streptomyces sp. NPDC001595]|uniref:trans-aconitate methyltransferase n=1 Tax=Streptomyces sp. NPDC001532 TaxID=3154520 RepID=UPI0033169723
MSDTRTTTPRGGAIPAQPDAAARGTAGPAALPGAGPTTVRASEPAAERASGPEGVRPSGSAVVRASGPDAARGSGSAVVRASGAAARPGEPEIARPGGQPGDGEGERPGERPTVRLRDDVDAAQPQQPPRYAPEWLELREPADAAARAADLLDPLRIRLANLPGRSGGLVVHDLGCGTGSMGRWLAPRLDGAQHWILHDRDPYLLHFAAVASPRAAADGSRVTVETRRGDIARLTPDSLGGASLVTASALLDVLTREEVDVLAAACAGAGAPALLTLSVAGRVDLSPADPLDQEITEAFNAHQRRAGLLGPDAVTVACEAFAAHGATVQVRPSAWRLGPGDAALTVQWLRGWVGAAVEQRPELAERAGKYLAARLAACAAGELRVTVHHSDLLALARPTGGES